MGGRKLIGGMIAAACCACTPVPPQELTFTRLGDPLAPALSEAVAAVLVIEGERDTVLAWESPVRQWNVRFGLREGDAGFLVTDSGRTAFGIERVWSAAEWEGSAWRAVESGAFPDSTWLAGSYGGSGQRLSPGSGCWVLEADTLGASPVADGTPLRVEWSQWPESPVRPERPRLPLELALKWGDEDQVLPAFWRAIARWGAPAQWHIVCPCREAFGVEGIPRQGLPPRAPVHFKASISR